jgi:hypothetical protein
MAEHMWIFASPVTWAFMAIAAMFVIMAIGGLIQFALEGIDFSRPVKVVTVTKIKYVDRPEVRLTDNEAKILKQVGDDVRQSLH